MSNDFFRNMVREFDKRNNPSDLKPILVGEIARLNPLTVSIDEGACLLVENDQLEISEAFRFRCNIDAGSKLSSGVVSDLSNAQGVSETHSYTGAPCSMPSAIASLAGAISKINTELLNLKCNLKVGDFVAVGSLEQEDKYILIDKILSSEVE